MQTNIAKMKKGLEWLEELDGKRLSFRKILPGITLKWNELGIQLSRLAFVTLFSYSNQAPNFQELIKWTKNWFKNRISGHFVPEGRSS